MEQSDQRRLERIESQIEGMRVSLVKIEKRLKGFALACYVYFTILIILILFA